MNARVQIEEHIRQGVGAGLFTPESEEAVIAAILCAPDACGDTFERLTPGHFADELLGRLYGAAQGLHRAGRTPSAAIIRDAMGADTAFSEWGGIDQLQVLSELGSIRGLDEHAAAVIDRSERRAIRRLVDGVGQKTLDTAAGDAQALLTELERGASEIARGSATAEQWISAADMIRGAIAYAKSRSGRIDYPFGVGEVDDFTGGMNAAEVTLLAARPGMGKTIGAQTVVRANAAQGRGCCFFSLEMAAHPLGLRLASDVAYRRNGVSYSVLGQAANPTADAAMKNKLSPELWARLEEAEEIVANWPLLIDTRPGLTIAQIEAAVRRQHRRWERQGVPPGPVVIDHLGKVRPSKDRRGNRTAEVADVSAEASEMAKRLGVPVLALVQLNRGVEGRDDKRPMLADLRQAGELEEDARQVLFLYRPEYYLREGPPGEDMAAEMDRKDKLAKVAKQMFWIIGKNSHGPLGQVQTFCDIGSSAIRSWNP